MTASTLPLVIQGGMGIAVSNWKLARAVSLTGQLGVVSGTALDTVFVRRLQDGDFCGSIRRALAHLPLPGVADEMIRRYWRPEGRAPGEPYRLLPMYRQTVSAMRERVTIAANFVEVWLAKEGHAGRVGLNLLTKVQLPTLASLYGAMLAKVDVVLMGAGIPREIPGVLDAFAGLAPAAIRLDVVGDAGHEPEFLRFDPADHQVPGAAALARPQFFAIVAAHSLAANLARKATGRVDGFVVEGATAGGHNAPPRGAAKLNERGEPVYGERDDVDLQAMRDLGVPFWLAGGMGSPEGLRAARAMGATGIQVGTAFAYAEESGIAPELKASVLRAVADGTVDVFTDPRASPTGFPFKVVRAAGVPEQGDGRTRICDLGYLRSAYRRSDGRIGYRCASEPVEQYVAAGGAVEDTVGRRCLCNGLTAVIGQAQERAGSPMEAPLLTSGDGVRDLKPFAVRTGGYTAADVVRYLLG
ncbi:MAG: nitronate monooxygenase [Gemmatimonadaceae bacterium]